MNFPVDTFATRRNVALKSVALALLSAQLCFAETIMSPRTQAEHDAEMKALSEQYAPKRDPQLEAQVAASGGVLPAAGAKPDAASIGLAAQAQEQAAQRTARSLAMAAIGGKTAPAKGTKVRAELLAVGLDKFSFGGKVYDTTSLTPVLAELGKLYTLDHLALLDTGEPIQLNHLVELSKLGERLKLPAMYTSNGVLRAVNTR
jgi:hypothetical protein